MSRWLSLFLFAPALLLAACLRHENDPGQGGLTVGENRELDEAAAMLEARPKAPAPPEEPPAVPQSHAPVPQLDNNPPGAQPAQQRPGQLGGIGRAGADQRQ